MYLNHAIIILAFSFNFLWARLILHEIMGALKEKSLSLHIIYSTLQCKQQCWYKCIAHMTAANISVVLFCRCSEPLSPERRQDTFNVYHALGKKVGLDKKCHRNQTISSCLLAITDSQIFTLQQLPVKNGTPVSSSIMKQSMPNYILDQFMSPTCLPSLHHPQLLEILWDEQV